MTLIEGVGNEVVHFAAALLLAAVAAIAWWSTNAHPYRYRVTLAMRQTAPQPVSLRIRSGGSRTIESNPVTEDVVPLQEMDSMVDADMALLDHNRLRFYRRVNSPRLTQNSTETMTEEPESQNESEPAGNAQIREMDSIVSAMEADENTGRTVFNTPAEDDSDSTSPMIAEVKRDRKDSKNAVTENSTPDNSTNNTSNDEMQLNDRRILIKLKYLNDTLKEVEGSLDELLKDFKWRHFSRELSTERRVRLIYNGRVLIDEGATLSALGLRHRSVVHCLVHPQTGRTEENANTAANPATETRPERGERQWDLENILMTLVSVALTVMWFFRCEYSNMFTASASVALFGLTLFYSVAIIGLYFSDTFSPDRRRPQPVTN